MVELNNELKKKLGFIIEHERLLKYETNKIDWNYKAFLKIDEISVCDLKTYRKLRKGYTVYNDEIYYVLMKQLGYEIYDDEKLNLQFKNLIKEMEYDFNRMDLNHFKRNYIMAQELLQPVANTQPYKTMLDALNLIEKCILRQERINDTQYAHYQILLPIFNHSFQDLVRFILSDYLIQNHDHDEIKLHKINLKTHHKSYLIQQHIILLMQNGQYFDSIDPLIKLTKVLTREKNHNRLIFIKILLLYSILPFSQNRSAQLEFELDELVKYNYRQCSSITLAVYYIYKGLFLYIKKQYKEGFASLKKALSYQQPQFYCLIIVYMNYINRVQFIENIDVLYTANQEIDYPKGFQVKYQYFKMKKQGVPLRTLENHLLNDVLKTLHKFDTIDIDVFTEELTYCISETKDYKALFTWNEEIEIKGEVLV